MSTCLPALALLALALPAAAQDRKALPPPPKPSPEKTQRLVHPVRGGDPAVLVEALALHAPDVRASAAGPAVVVSGPADAVAEAARLLDQIDRPRRTVVVEVTLAEVTARKADDKKDGPEIDLSGDVLGKLDELAKVGQATLQRVRVSAVEGQPVSAQTGGSRPMSSGTVVGGRGPGAGGGPVQRSISYHQVGTTVKLTAQVGADGAVSVDLNVQDSSIRPGEAEDAPVALETGTLTTKLSIPPGKAVLAQAVRKDGKGGRAVAFVVVTARAVEPGVVAAR